MLNKIISQMRASEHTWYHVEVITRARQSKKGKKEWQVYRSFDATTSRMNVASL
jgi:hypothetical protein